MKFNKIGVVAVLQLICFVSISKAQVSPPVSMYYLNRLLYNPAIAGETSGMNVGVSYKNNLTGSNGQTLNNAITLDYGTGKSGFGLAYTNDKDGIISFNSFEASYSYGIQFDQEKKIRFGLSLGASAFKLDLNELIGDTDDMVLRDFNQQGYLFDGDLGINYTDKALTISAVAPNLRNLINGKKVSDGYNSSTYYLSASYKVPAGNISLAPLVMFRGLSAYGTLVDVGLNTDFGQGKFNLMAIYHSSRAISVGLGFVANKNYQIQAAYSLPLNQNLKYYTYGAVELGIKACLFKQ